MPAATRLVSLWVVNANQKEKPNSSFTTTFRSLQFVVLPIRSRTLTRALSCARTTPRNEYAAQARQLERRVSVGVCVFGHRFATLPNRPRPRDSIHPVNTNPKRKSPVRVSRRHLDRVFRRAAHRFENANAGVLRRAAAFPRVRSNGGLCQTATGNRTTDDSDL